jgi:hypothetical protein
VTKRTQKTAHVAVRHPLYVAASLMPDTWDIEVYGRLTSDKTQTIISAVCTDVASQRVLWTEEFLHQRGWDVADELHTAIKHYVSAT